MARGSAIATLAAVLMPEATMDEDQLTQTRKDEVRSAREVPHMKSVSVSHRMYQPSDNHLWAGVLGMYSPHYLATCRP